MQVSSFLRSFLPKKSVQVADAIKTAEKASKKVQAAKDKILCDSLGKTQKSDRMLPVVEEIFDPSSPNYHMFSMYI